MFARALVVGLVSVGPVLAQSSAVVSVTQPIQLQVDNFPLVTQAPGPISPPFEMVSGINLDQSLFRVEPVSIAPPGALGWNILCDVRTVSVGQPSASSLLGSLEIVLTAPQQLTGVFVLVPSRWNSSNGTQSGDLDVDIDADGIPDYFAGSSSYTEIPLMIGPSGTPIRLQIALTASLTPIPSVTVIGGIVRSWQVMFVPDVYGMERYATGCVDGFIGQRRQLPGFECQFITQSTFPQAMGWAWLVVGLAPTNVTLPWAPSCPLLIDANVLFPPDAGSAPWQQWWTVPAVQLPPGWQFHAQIVWMNAAGSVLSSEAFRTF